MGNIVSIAQGRRSARTFTALEFFAGIGLSRAGLEAAGFHTLWANDIDHTTSRTYSGHWGSEKLTTSDVFMVDAADFVATDP